MRKGPGGASIKLALLLPLVAGAAAPAPGPDGRAPTVSVMTNGLTSGYVIRFGGPVDHAFSRLLIVQDGRVLQNSAGAAGQCAECAICPQQGATARHLRVALDRQVDDRRQHLRGRCYVHDRAATALTDGAMRVRIIDTASEVPARPRHHRGQ